MIITSSQQLYDITYPYEALDMSEFESITLKFGSFVSISKRKKFNFLNLLKLIVEDDNLQKIYCNLIGEENLHVIIKAYLSCTPNIYKKIFRSKLNAKKK